MRYVQGEVCGPCGKPAIYLPDTNHIKSLNGYFLCEDHWYVPSERNQALIAAREAELARIAANKPSPVNRFEIVFQELD